MYYKNDWAEARKKLEAFWKGEPCERACIGILAPRKTSKLPKFPHLTNGPWLGGLEKFSDGDREEVRKWWMDPEQNHDRMKLWFENTYWGGEAVPNTYADSEEEANDIIRKVENGDELLFPTKKADLMRLSDIFTVVAVFGLILILTTSILYAAGIVVFTNYKILLLAGTLIWFAGIGLSKIAKRNSQNQGNRTRKH